MTIFNFKIEYLCKECFNPKTETPFLKANLPLTKHLYNSLVHAKIYDCIPGTSRSKIIKGINKKFRINLTSIFQSLLRSLATNFTSLAASSEVPNELQNISVKSYVKLTVIRHLALRVTIQQKTL